jgi:multicomponent Na+:H+ antiporter subunit A
VTLAVVASALLGASGLRAGLSPFASAPAEIAALPHHEKAHEPPVGMWIGPIALGLASLGFGILPGLFAPAASAAAASILGPGFREAEPLHLSLWHGFTPVLGLSVVTIVVALLLYARRHRVPMIAWPFDTSRLYTGAVALLDRISAASAPVMQAKPLRTYVLFIVITVGTLVGAALVLGGGGWTLARTTAPRPHDYIIVFVICAAAITAARCSDSMTAVICLGTVGYGVALTFMFFGAPDLAMTQFSVETLTVVIFVLVFRHFGNFGMTSPPLIRWRDATIAAGFGLIFATLTLLVGSNGSTSRLSNFFVDAAPKLAHGRNIVNVILVDFRALDTLGEITVLVTAAIGVHALLRITAEKRGRP